MLPRCFLPLFAGVVESSGGVVDLRTGPNRSRGEDACQLTASGQNVKRGVQLADGTICYAEVHWYEAHGIGPKEMKIKRILEIQ